MKNLILTAAALFGLAAASMGQTLPAYLPSDGLVGWWPFNGNANDESGNGNDGTVISATLNEDRFGFSNSAFEIDGIDCPSPKGINLPLTLNNGDSYSISIWVKTNDPSKQNQAFLNSSPHQYIGIGYNHVTAPSKISTFLGNGTWLYLGSELNSDYPDIENWHNITIVKTTDSILMYTDGLESISLVFNPILNSGTIDYFIVGASSINGGLNCYETLNGSIDDIAIYNRALTQEEITALYTGEPVNPPTTCNPLPSNLQNGLVGYWPFCGNANDESGNGNDGTVNGATLTEDRFGVANSAYDFDGVDDWINVDDDSSLQCENVTLSIWFKTTSTSSKYLLFKQNNLDASNENYGFELNPFGNNTHYLYGHYGNDCIVGQGWVVNEGQLPPFSDNNWHHFVGTIGPDSMISYLDGQHIVSRISPDSIMKVCAGSELLIGKAWTSYPKYFPGTLDDIGIWNRALTADEVQQLYTLNACTFTVYDTVTVTQTVYDTVTTYTTVTDTLIINTLITELAPPANSNTIKVFPNPANSHITIDYGNFALMNGYQLRIENSLGQQVFQTNIAQQSDYLSLSTWGGNGLYFVHIVDPQGNTIDIRKIVLQ